MEKTNKSGLTTAGLVLGIVGVCTSFIPIINNISFAMGILSVIFGIVSLVKKVGKGKAITAIILGILAVVITVNSQQELSNSLDTVSKDLDKAVGNNTEEVLKNDVEVSLGKFEVKKEEYFTDTKLTVKVTNKMAEKKSFSIHIEAIDEKGERIGEDYVYANDLNAGQSQSFDVFEYVESEKIEQMKKAQFKIVEASVY